MKSALVIAGIAIFALSSAQDAPVLPAWKPKAGSSIKYTSVRKTADYEIKMTVTEKVSEVKPDGTVSLEITQNEFSGTAGNMDLTDFLRDTRVTQNVTLSPVGALLDFKSSGESGVTESMHARLSNVNDVVFPDKAVKPGNSWTVKKKPISGLTYDAESKYTFVGTDTVGSWKCYKISVDSYETGGDSKYSSKGTVWVLVDDGTLVKSVLETKNFETSYGLSDPTVTVQRVA